MANEPYRLTQTGAEVQADLNDIEALGLATEETAGKMSAADKQKLDGIESGAEANTIETIEVDGAVQAPDANKKVSIDTKRILTLKSLPEAGTYTEAQFEERYCSLEDFNKARGGGYGIVKIALGGIPSATEYSPLWCFDEIPDIGFIVGTIYYRVSVMAMGGVIVNVVATPIPTLLSQLSEDTTHRVVTDAEKTAWNGKYDKPVDGIPSTAMTEAVQTSLGKADSALQSQKQADWNEANSNDPAYIKNKPTIPSGVVVDQVYDGTSANAQSGVAMAGALAGKQDTISDLSDIRTGAGLGATAVQPEAGKGLFSGNYNDLSNKPTIPDAQVQANWNESDSASKAYIQNKPTIPDAQIQSDWNQSDNTAKDYIKNKPSIPAAQVNSDWNANSGVAQILNKPSIPDAVEANPTVPSGTTPTDLTGLKVGDDYYAIPEGGGGAGIDEVTQPVVSTENGGTNTVRITLTNGDHYDVYIKNGKSSAGLFPDAAALASAQPSPNVGDYAFVGSGFPADIYVCQTAGTWTDSGDDYDGDNVDLTDYPKVGPGLADLEVADEKGFIALELNEGNIKTKWFDSRYVYDPSKISLKGTAATFSSGDTITITNVPNVRNKYILSFCAEISAIGKLTIQYGNSNIYSRGIITIDSTNVEVAVWGTSTGKTTHPHSLTFSKYIQVIIKTTETIKAKLIILTDNDSFELDDIDWGGSSEDIIASAADGGSFANAELTIAYHGFADKLWVFGDSWTEMWPAEMEKLGQLNFLIDGFSGRRGSEAYDSLLLDLRFGKPNCILWMLGMNDSDSSTAINSSWKTSFDNLLAICESLGIRLIACTIPNRANRNNLFKNEYIKNSGVEYLDVAATVGCENDANGYDGLVEDGRIPPTVPLGMMKVSLFLIENINTMLK